MRMARGESGHSGPHLPPVEGPGGGRPRQDGGPHDRVRGHRAGAASPGVRQPGAGRNHRAPGEARGGLLHANGAGRIHRLPGGRVTVAYEARITGAAKAFREKMFPGYVSDFLRTDPEFIERFDNFAFDEVVAQVNLDDETRYLGWLATLLGCQGIDEYRAILLAALRCGNASWPRSATSRRKVVATRRQRRTPPPTSRWATPKSCLLPLRPATYPSSATPAHSTPSQPSKTQASREAKVKAPAGSNERLTAKRATSRQV